MKDFGSNQNCEFPCWICDEQCPRRLKDFKNQTKLILVYENGKGFKTPHRILLPVRIMYNYNLVMDEVLKTMKNNASIGLKKLYTTRGERIDEAEKLTHGGSYVLVGSEPGGFIAVQYGNMTKTIYVFENGKTNLQPCRITLCSRALSDWQSVLAACLEGILNCREKNLIGKKFGIPLYCRPIHKKLSLHSMSGNMIHKVEDLEQNGSYILVTPDTAPIKIFHNVIKLPPLNTNENSAVEDPSYSPYDLVLKKKSGEPDEDIPLIKVFLPGSRKLRETYNMEETEGSSVHPDICNLDPEACLVQENNQDLSDKLNDVAESQISKEEDTCGNICNAYKELLKKFGLPPNTTITGDKFFSQSRQPLDCRLGEKEQHTNQPQVDERDSYIQIVESNTVNQQQLDDQFSISQKNNSADERDERSINQQLSSYEHINMNNEQLNNDISEDLVQQEETQYNEELESNILTNEVNTYMNLASENDQSRFNLFNRNQICNEESIKQALELYKLLLKSYCDNNCLENPINSQHNSVEPISLKSSTYKSDSKSDQSRQPSQNISNSKSDIRQTSQIDSIQSSRNSRQNTRHDSIKSDRSKQDSIKSDGSNLISKNPLTEMPHNSIRLTNHSNRDICCDENLKDAQYTDKPSDNKSRSSAHFAKESSIYCGSKPMDSNCHYEVQESRNKSIGRMSSKLNNCENNLINSKFQLSNNVNLECRENESKIKNLDLPICCKTSNNSTIDLQKNEQKNCEINVQNNNLSNKNELNKIEELWKNLSQKFIEQSREILIKANQAQNNNAGCNSSEKDLSRLTTTCSTTDMPRLIHKATTMCNGMNSLRHESRIPTYRYSILRVNGKHCFRNLKKEVNYRLFPHNNISPIQYQPNKRVSFDLKPSLYSSPNLIKANHYNIKNNLIQKPDNIYDLNDRYLPPIDQAISPSITPFSIEEFSDSENEEEINFDNYSNKNNCCSPFKRTLNSNNSQKNVFSFETTDVDLTLKKNTYGFLNTNVRNSIPCKSPIIRKPPIDKKLTKNQSEINSEITYLSDDEDKQFDDNDKSTYFNESIANNKIIYVNDEISAYQDECCIEESISSFSSNLTKRQGQECLLRHLIRESNFRARLEQIQRRNLTFIDQLQHPRSHSVVETKRSKFLNNLCISKFTSHAQLQEIINKELYFIRNYIN